MDVNDFMKGSSIPGDLTLDQCTAYIIGVDPDDLKRLSVRQKLWIRYVIRRPGEPEVDADGNMSLDEFRELCAQGVGFIVLSDSEGGVAEEPSPYPTMPLVNS
jgi:hypothetical protein